MAYADFRVALTSALGRRDISFRWSYLGAVRPTRLPGFEPMDDDYLTLHRPHHYAPSSSKVNTGDPVLPILQERLVEHVNCAIMKNHSRMPRLACAPRIFRF